MESGLAAGKKETAMESAKLDAETRQSFLFLHLLHSFESAALIGLGKLPGPDGQCKVELEAVSFSIDMLDMIKARTRGNLKEDEDRYLERTISNLKLNFLTEQEKAAKGDEERGGKAEGEESEKT
jgi:hypothetical protein